MVSILISVYVRAAVINMASRAKSGWSPFCESVTSQKEFGHSLGIAIICANCHCQCYILCRPEILYKASYRIDLSNEEIYEVKHPDGRVLMFRVPPAPNLCTCQ